MQERKEAMLTEKTGPLIVVMAIAPTALPTMDIVTGVGTMAMGIREAANAVAPAVIPDVLTETESRDSVLDFPLSSAVIIARKHAKEIADILAFQDEISIN